MFKRKDRMPAYIWGATSRSIGGSGWRLFGPTQVDQFTPFVPTTARLVYSTFGLSPSERLFEDAPCDFQLPWASFVFPGASAANVFGLTLFGEVYVWGQSYSSDPQSMNGEERARVRCIRKARVTGIGKAIKQIISHSGNCVALSSDGNVWRLSTDSRTSPVQYTLPSGVLFDKIGSVRAATGYSHPAGLYGIDSSGNMYVDSAPSGTTAPNTFYTLSKWVQSLEISDGGSYPTNNDFDQIDLAFTAAPAGGRTAAGKATIIDKKVATVLLTDPGRGYATAPTVTAGAGGAAITATLFSDGPFAFMNGWPVGQGGTAYGTSSGNRALGTGWKKVYPNSGFLSGVGIKANGELWAWNNANYGSSNATPAKIADGVWKSAAVTSSGAVAVRDDYTLWAWGRNWSGILGTSTNWETFSSTPTQIATDYEWVDVFATNAGSFSDFAIAIRKDSQRRDFDQPMEYWPDSYFA